MKIAIAGSSGYIGKNLIKHLAKSGASIKIISRIKLYGEVESLATEIAGCHAVINLAGSPILQRWNKLNRSTIYSSRIITTKNLTQAINSLSDTARPKVYISASAVGIYHTNGIHDENSKLYDPGFVGRVVNDWESASEDLDNRVRRAIFRIGVVLGKESQTIRKLLPLFKLGLGGKIGNGQQPFSFIHINDLINGFSNSLTDERYSGIFNMVAPEQITNEIFTNTFAKKVSRPTFFTVPPIVLRLIYGKASSLITTGSFVVPKHLNELNFTYQYPTISDCLDEVIASGGI